MSGMVNNQEIQKIVDSITSDLTEPATGWSVSEAATCCVYWCLVHKAWKEGIPLNKSEAIRQLQEGPLKNRTKTSIELKTQNVTSTAQELLESGYSIYHKGRYRKRSDGSDLGPMVCKGYTVAPNKQAILREILPRALREMNLLGSSDPKPTLPDSIDLSCFIRAIDRIDRNTYAPHGKNHTYEVVYKGKGYPPLAVLSFAIEEIYQVSIPAGTYKGDLDGKGFKLLEAAGLVIVPLDEAAGGPVQSNPKATELRPAISEPDKQIENLVSYEESKLAGWLMLTKENTSIFSDGYDDDPSNYYSWDNTVANYEEPNIGDGIVVWDGQTLIGASCIEKIERGEADKLRYRCPECLKTSIRKRTTKRPAYICKCKFEFDEPKVDEIRVKTFRAFYQKSWVDLPGSLDEGRLRALCDRPKTQHSIRKFDYPKFLEELSSASLGNAARLLTNEPLVIVGGHKPRVVKARVGQAKFRKQLLRRYGETCALSGPAPARVLDAAHLYSYAEMQEHDEMGGLLIRKDLHKLFDEGLIRIDPKTLQILIDGSLNPYPTYAGLNGKALHVRIPEKAREWFRIHYEFHTQGLGD